jgi:hypothetical protein
MMKDGAEIENKYDDWFCNFQAMWLGKEKYSFKRGLKIHIFWFEAALMGVHLPPYGRMVVSCYLGSDIPARVWRMSALLLIRILGSTLPTTQYHVSGELNSWQCDCENLKFVV